MFQIMKKKPIILINSLLLNADPLMFLKFLTQLLSTQRQGFLLLLVKIIRDFDIDTAHGFDDTSIRMVKSASFLVTPCLVVAVQPCME